MVVMVMFFFFFGPVTGDALLKPQLLKMLPFVLHRLNITLQPSLEMFESQLLRLINADYHNTVKPSFSGFRNSQILDRLQTVTEVASRRLELLPIIFW